jgi:hypothetical protein
MNDGAAGSDSGGTNDAATADGAQSHGGSVIFEDLELPGSGLPDEYTISASLGAPGPAPYMTGCPGGTQMLSCCYQANGAPAGAVSPPVSAGTISLTDGTTSLGTLPFNTGTIGKMMVGLYGSIASGATTPLWQGSDTLGVSAPGATVGAFHGTLRAPPAIAGVTPYIRATPRLTPPRTQDFVISWTPDTVTGESMVFATAFNTGNPAIITCTVDDSAGTLTVPAAILGMLPSGPQTLQVSLTRLVQTTVTASNASVQLVAITVLPGPIVVQ